MAAGKAFVKQKPGYDNLFYCPKNIAEKVNAWLKGKLFLFNNNYGSNWDMLLEKVKEVIAEKKVKLIMLDNLMTIDLECFDGDENKKQKQFIKSVKDLAKSENVHIILVCHPRKEQSFQLLRKESIAGTADLTNLCDNLLLSHRVGNDFERRAKDFFGEDKIAKYLNYDMVVEIAKNRSLGVVDYLIGLYYEQETRRVKNDVAENIVYGWQERPVQTSIDDICDLPEDSWTPESFDNEERF